MILAAILLVVSGLIFLIFSLSTESALVNKYPKQTKINTKAKSFILIAGIVFLFIGTFLLINSIK